MRRDVSRLCVGVMFFPRGRFWEAARVVLGGLGRLMAGFGEAAEKKWTVKTLIFLMLWTDRLRMDDFFLVCRFLCIFAFQIIIYGNVRKRKETVHGRRLGTYGPGVADGTGMGRGWDWHGSESADAASTQVGGSGGAPTDRRRPGAPDDTCDNNDSPPRNIYVRNVNVMLMIMRITLTSRAYTFKIYMSLLSLLS